MPLITLYLAATRKVRFTTSFVLSRKDSSEHILKYSIPILQEDCLYVRHYKL